MNKCLKREKTTGHTGESAFLFCRFFSCVYSNVRFLILGLHSSGNSDLQEGEPDGAEPASMTGAQNAQPLGVPAGGGRGEGLRIGGEDGSYQQKRTSFKSLHFSEERNEQFQPYYQMSFF